MNKSIVNQRDSYWDIAKAVLMYLVILGHTMQFFVYQGENQVNFWNDPIFKGIYIFHMPLFMLISGYFAAFSFNNRGLSVIPRYLKRLALPCVGMGLYLIIRRACLHMPISPMRIWCDCVNLWFLIVIFECLIWYLIFIKFGNNTLTKVFLFILPILLALNVHYLGKMAIIWPHTSQFTYLWPFFLMGCYIRKYNLTTKLTDYKSLGGVFIIIYIISFIIFNEEWYVYRTPLNQTFERLVIHLIRTAAAIAGCGAFLFIMKQMAKFLNYVFIQKIGQATLALYVLQSIIYSILWPYMPEGLGYIEANIISFIILITLFYFYRITRKIPIFSYLAYGESHQSKHS